jgi:hypothetical protein
VSGRFETEGGIVIVRVSDGHIAKADMEDMLRPETLAKVGSLKLSADSLDARRCFRFRGFEVAIGL